MIYIFEFPIVAFAILFLGIFGINLIPVLTFILSVSLVISILYLFITEHKLLNLIVILINIALLFFLDGKKFYLWDILEWLF